MSSSAVRAVAKFRLHELKGLQGHIARHGPLPPPNPDSPPTQGIRLPNPFLPHRNPKTGRWAPPKYSLRRQAELIKKAKETNSLHLLPPGPKLHKPQVLAEVLRAKDGEGSKELPEKLKPLSFEADWVGKFTPKEKPEVPLYAQKKRMFKGHKWERTKERREAHRSMLLRDMDKRVRRWKDYHRRRRPDPLKPPKRLSGKLPF
ncbi:60s ribosomal protein l25 [Moniliophthora roreri MCA 2997]|uniref:60s ribosomal protein l25 n=1 Tax=Moniliophthora roreri (strain MCA 2997) TaxID=1381753 RepID=V2X917_MONRO|nr:60s ribosomal protein l25 [Moniliophthora roreri MCA 2997]